MSKFINEPIVLHHYEQGARVEETWHHNVMRILDLGKEPIRATIYYTGALRSCRDEVLINSIIAEDTSWPKPRPLEFSRSNIKVSIRAAEKFKPRARKLRWFYQDFPWDGDLLILHGWDCPESRLQSIPPDRIIVDLTALRAQVEGELEYG
ncbi:MAG: hypothetical protein JO166_11690 [Deltaproteobacteria bacterium]|nr:hypothetical protein [Deltaproteobacteria bacterium]